MIEVATAVVFVFNMSMGNFWYSALVKEKEKGLNAWK
jgi:hypothetical protein